MSASAAIAIIGHNNPPEPTPFDLSRVEIEDLFAEAKNFLDGEPVTTQAQADAIGRLKHLLTEAGKLADDRRAEERQPHVDAAAAVQSRYAPLLTNFKGTPTKQADGKVRLALDACEKALLPFLKAEDARKAAVAAEAQRKAKEAADAAAAAFQATQHDDLAGREAAEALAANAKAAEATARRAEKDGAKVGGGARATTLKTIIRPQVSDRGLFLRWCKENRPDELGGLLQAWAERLCSAGQRGLPGVTYTEEAGVRS